LDARNNSYEHVSTADLFSQVFARASTY
jgi:hypothetical protein